MKRMTSACLRLAALSAAAAMQQAHADDLRFDQAFSTGGGPAVLHYQASYRAGGAPRPVITTCCIGGRSSKSSITLCTSR